MAKKILNNRLPRNFHKTFLPERQYINAILRFAAKGGAGDIQAIGSDTGIPTGKSSGKVAPTLDYCRGMGLITLSDDRSATKRPELTPFGRVVLLEDPYLKQQITQWIAHLNLCNPISGSDTWHRAFFDGTHILGMEFTRDQLEDYLASSYMTPRGKLIGPLIRMYEDGASFSICGALSEDNNIIRRNIAPISDEFGNGYGAWLIKLIEEHFPGIGQVTVTELDTIAGWRTIPGWNASDTQKILEIIDRKGLIIVDRQMNPWILRCNEKNTSVWPKIYNDLI